MSDDKKSPNQTIRNQAMVDFATACACFNIRKTARAITNLYDSELQPTKLRSTQATLLMAIAAAEKPTISRLAEVLGMDRTTLARDLKPLTAQGLVEITSGDDRRTRQIQLTNAGQKKLSEVIPLWEQAQAKVINAGLGRERWNKLYDELQNLIELAQA
jgi:DNA-binding MarR family transcriptional regulator